MPELRQFSRSRGMARAVMATIGTCPPVSRSTSRMCLVASRPPMTGICRSMNTRSKDSLREHRLGPRLPFSARGHRHSRFSPAEPEPQLDVHRVVLDQEDMRVPEMRWVRSVDDCDSRAGLRAQRLVAGRGCFTSALHEFGLLADRQGQDRGALPARTPARTGLLQARGARAPPAAGEPHAASTPRRCPARPAAVHAGHADKRRAGPLGTVAPSACGGAQPLDGLGTAREASSTVQPQSSQGAAPARSRFPAALSIDRPTPDCRFKHERARRRAISPLVGMVRGHAP